MADDLSKGIGLGYIPISSSPAAANKDAFRQFVTASKTDVNGSSSRHTMKHFNELIKNKVDEADTSKAHCTDFDKIFHRRMSGNN